MAKFRLHKLISGRIKDLSLEWTLPEIQKNISQYGVFVDSVLVKNRLTWVFDFQLLDFAHWPIREATDFSKLKILYEDKDFLAVFKTSGIVVERGNGHEKDNLIHFLHTQYKSDFFAIHRLDKETSGILLIAKNQPSLEFFQKQFKERVVDKKYLALVNGKLDKTLKITNFQSRDESYPTKQKLFWEIPAKANLAHFRQSISIFKPVAFCQETNTTLVEVQILTGRMHQIRLQAEALDLPIIGDTKYAYKSNEKLNIILQNPIVKKCVVAVNQLPDIEICQTTKEFERFQDVFGDSSLKLLANYIKIQTPSNTTLELKVVEL